MGRPVERLHLAAATVLGVGYFPVASGTAGSVPGLALAWLAWSVGGRIAMLAAAVVVTVIGFMSAGVVARTTGDSDPGIVVIDETAGQMVTLLFHVLTWQTLLAGFFLFRLFDIIKPPPIRRLERLSGGIGIMVDDLAAGLLANLVLHGILFIYPELLGSS